MGDYLVPPLLVALVVRVPSPELARPLPCLFMQRPRPVPRDQASNARSVAAVTLEQASQRSGVLGVSGRLGLLRLEGRLATQVIDGGLPTAVAVLKRSLVIVHGDVVQMDLAYQSTALVGELHRVFDIDPRAWVIRIGPAKQPLVVLHDLTTIAQEIDSEVAFVEVALDAQPAVKPTFALPQLLAAALVACVLACVLPVTANLARVGGLEFLVNLDVGGDPLRIGATAIGNKAVVAPPARSPGGDFDSLYPQLKRSIVEQPPVHAPKPGSQAFGVAPKPVSVVVN